MAEASHNKTESIKLSATFSSDCERAYLIKEDSMYSGFFPPLGGEKLELLRRQPTFHEDFRKWNQWFLKLARPWQNAPEISSCYKALPENLGNTSYKRSLFIYSGGLVQSLNGSKTRSSVILSAKERYLRAFSVEMTTLASGATGETFDVPELELLGEVSVAGGFTEDACCQVAVQTGGDEDLIALRLPSAIQFWSLSDRLTDQDDEDDPFVDKIRFDYHWEVRMPKPVAELTLYTDVCFHPSRPGKGLVVASDGKVYQFDAHSQQFELVSIVGMDSPLKPFEPWYGIRTMANPLLAYCASRTAFRVLDFRLRSKNVPLFEYYISDKDSKIGEEIYNIQTTLSGDGEIIFVITDREVRAFDRRHIAPGPVWSRLHRLNRTAPLYSLFVPDGSQVSPSRYFPSGSLFLAGHNQNCVSQYDVASEHRVWQSETFIPRTPLAGAHALPFKNYSCIPTAREVIPRLEEAGESIACNAKLKYDLPLAGLARHVIDSPDGREFPVLLTCNATGDIFCSIQQEGRNEEEVHASDIVLQKAAFGRCHGEAEVESGRNRVDWGVIISEDFQQVNLDLVKRGWRSWRSDNRGILEERAKGNIDFTAEIIKNKRRVAFHETNGEYTSEARVLDHFCALDACDGNPESVSEEFEFQPETMLNEAAFAHELATSKYLFVPGMQEALYLWPELDEDTGGTQDLFAADSMYREATELLEQLKIHVNVIPTVQPYLPQKNIALQLHEPNLTEEEREFLAAADDDEESALSRVCADGEGVIDPLLRDFMAAMKNDSVSRLNENQDPAADEYDPEVASFLDATRGVIEEPDEEVQFDPDLEDAVSSIGVGKVDRVWRHRKNNRSIARHKHASSSYVKRLVRRRKTGTVTASILALEASMLRKLKISSMETEIRAAPRLSQRTARRALLASELTSGADRLEDPAAARDPRTIDVDRTLEQLARSSIPLFMGGREIRSNPNLQFQESSEDVEATLHVGKRPIRDANFCETMSTMSTIRTGLPRPDYAFCDERLLQDEQVKEDKGQESPQEHEHQLQPEKGQQLELLNGQMSRDRQPADVPQLE